MKHIAVASGIKAGTLYIDKKATGRNILRLRRAKGLSVADLQQYFGFDAPQAIYKWQKGQTIPSTDNLLALSRLLDVPMENILAVRSEQEKSTPQEDDSCGVDHIEAMEER